MVYEGGVAVPAVVEQVDDGTWRMKGQDFEWTMAIPAGDTPGSADGVVTLIRNREVNVGGYGFLPNTYVDVWMLPPTSSVQARGSNIQPMASPAIYLGNILVNADGTFAKGLPVPANVEVGNYTLQANGQSFDNVPRSLNLGVRVLAVGFQLPVTGGGSDGVAGFAVVLLAVGMVMTFAVRRRRI